MLDRHKIAKTVLDHWDAVAPNWDAFDQWLRSQGWTEPRLREMGSFKVVFIHSAGAAVTKSDSEDSGHTRREWVLWRRARPAKRRYLARCYAYRNGLLIQEYVGPRCPLGDNCDSAKHVARQLRILDWGVNHSHRDNGMPIFFDYDACGPGWYVPKRGTPIDPPRITR